MTDCRCMFSTSNWHCKFNQLRWQNMSAHLTNETSYWLKKLLMHLNWAIYNVCDLNIDPHVCFFPTLSKDWARPIPLAQPEACSQRSERPVCARSPHRSRNGYPGWTRKCPECQHSLSKDINIAMEKRRLNMLNESTAATYKHINDRKIKPTQVKTVQFDHVLSNLLSNPVPVKLLDPIFVNLSSHESSTLVLRHIGKEAGITRYGGTERSWVIIVCDEFPYTK